MTTRWTIAAVALLMGLGNVAGADKAAFRELKAQAAARGWPTRN
jgi:hypothetical protein